MYRLTTNGREFRIEELYYFFFRKFAWKVVEYYDNLEAAQKKLHELETKHMRWAGEWRPVNESEIGEANEKGT